MSVEKEETPWLDAPNGDGLYWVWEPKLSIRDGTLRVVEVSTWSLGINRWSVWSIGTEESSPLIAFPGAKWRRVTRPTPPRV